jgi:hypothetical protein
VLYAAFFLVELGFNFDISTHRDSTAIAVTKPANAPSAWNTAAFRVDRQHINAQKLRLNKRFHPEKYIAVQVLSEAAVCTFFINEQGYSSYTSPLHIFFISPYSLRGPPTV